MSTPSQFIAILAVVFWVCSDLNLAAGSTETESSTSVAAQLHRATVGIRQLQHWYDRSTGLYRTTGWWNSANALTVLIDYARVRHAHRYDSVLANTFIAAQESNPGFLNKFYDDEGWWALAWIDAYDLTGNRQYLSAAESIFADMSDGWDGTCGGGIWWNKDRRYKNAIANELFLSVAAHLAGRDAEGHSKYLNWANREWQWFAHSEMINPQGLINDGLTIDSGSPASCRNNGQTTWSYNQGVVLGGLVELSRVNPDASLPESAQRIASAAIRALSDAKVVSSFFRTFQQH